MNLKSTSILFLLLLSQVMHAQLTSILEIYDINKNTRTTVFKDTIHFEAPNWTKDGIYLIVNSQGLLYKIPVSGGAMHFVNSGFADQCNNDHVLSPDGLHIAISHHTKSDGLSRIYRVPTEGGDPVLVTGTGPSYLHGWSPDGTLLSYCAERNGNYDVYTISVDGGTEKRLTSAPGLDDGPEFSPDGKFIYFNSVRTGKMQIWRMKIDGTEQQQITFDEFNNWFPHVSPNGSKIVFLSYSGDVEGHPANKNVRLRMMDIKDFKPVTIVELFGGQGTINVNSWSPESNGFAFVSYVLK